MAQKFIIVNNEIIMGNVEFHAELVRRNKPATYGTRPGFPFKREQENVSEQKPIGGGRFNWDKERKIVYFYDQSFDFGPVTRKQFYDALPNSRISPFMKDSEMFFSAKESLADAMKEYDAYKSEKRVIKLKTHPQYFHSVKKGDKTFEVRKNDRGFQVGSILILKEYIPAKDGQNVVDGAYTGDECKVEVTYVLRDYEPLNSEYVVLGIKLLKEVDNSESLEFKVSKEIIEREVSNAINEFEFYDIIGDNCNDKVAKNVVEQMTKLFS